MLVITRRVNQLGNRLCLFAHAVAFAEGHGGRVINLAFDPYEDGFIATARDPWCRFPVAPSVSVTARRLACATGNALRALCKASRIANSRARLPRLHSPVRVLTMGDVQERDMNASDFVRLARRTPYLLLDGWGFRDHQGIRRHAEAVRRYFRPVDEVREAAERAVQAARQNCDLLVGVHVRQGDFREFQGGAYFFDTPAYACLMSDVAAALSPARVGFLVCSNEAQDQADFGRLTVSFGPGAPLSDLAALAMCDRLMGPTSTFSRWAAFAGEVPFALLRRTEQGDLPQLSPESFQPSYT